MPHLIFLTFSFLVLSLVVPATAASTLKLTKHTSTSSFVLDRVRTNLKAKRDISKRSGMAIPHGAEEPFEKRASGDLVLNSKAADGVTYTVDIAVGGVTLPVVADTGSSQFWVAASGCASCSAAGMAESGLKLARGCQAAEEDFVLGKISGCLINSTVSLGDYKLSAASVLGVNQIDETIQDEGSYMSGIIGMAPSQAYPPLVSQLYTVGMISAPSVGFFLARDKDNAESEMTFGDVRTSSHIDASKSVMLKSQPNPNGLFEVILDSLSIGGKQISGSQTVDIDTGTTYLYMPTEYIVPVIKAIQDEGGHYYTRQGDYIFPCSGMNTSIDVVFGGVGFTINSQDLVGGEVADGSGWCDARISDSGSGSNSFWIMGDVFLHNVYSAFNTETGDVTLYGLKS